MDNTKKHLLHVEDDPDMQNFINAILGEMAVVIHANTLAEATKELNTNQYDIVLLDLTLPDGSGLDLLAQMKDMQLSIPTVVFSSHEVTDNLPGVRRVFVKHRYSENDLINTLQALCGI